MRYLYFIAVIAVIGCTGRYSGFKSFGPKVHYQLKTLGDGDLSIQSGDYLMIATRFCKTSNCDERSERNVAFTLVDSVGGSKFWTTQHLGNSLVLLLDSQPEAFWIELLHLKDIKLTWPLIAEMELLGAIRDRQYFGQSSYMDSLFHFREKKEIEKYLNSTTEIYNVKSGCYISISHWGDGDTISDGAGVSLAYQGYFTDGTKFDDTEKWLDSMKFEYGSPMQVILGLELGIEGLTEGTEAKLIIPSQLAFGKEGSSTGLVPPFEPIVYDLKIVSVKKEAET